MVALSACAGWQARPELPLREATAEQLATLLQERARAIRTMKGLFQVTMSGPGIPFAQRMEGAMFYRRPDVLRLQGFTRVGGVLFEFVMGEERFRLRLPMIGRVYTGPVTDLDQLGKIGRPIHLAAMAMQHVTGDAELLNARLVRLLEDGDRYRLEVLRRPAGPDGQADVQPVVRRVWFERQTLHVVEEEWLTETGEVEARMWFEDFRPLILPDGQALRTTTEAGFGPAVVARPEDGRGGMPSDGRTEEPRERMVRPFRVKLEDGQGRGTLQLVFRELVPNPELRPAELGLALPQAVDGQPVAGPSAHATTEVSSR